jgi:hypothetical protein
MLLCDLAQEFNLEEPTLLDILRRNGINPPSTRVVVREHSVEKLRNLLKEHLSLLGPANPASIEVITDEAASSYDTALSVPRSSEPAGATAGSDRDTNTKPPPDEFLFGTINHVTERGACFVGHDLAPGNLFYENEKRFTFEKGDQVSFRVRDWNARPRPTATDVEFLSPRTLYGQVVEWENTGFRGYLRPSGGTDDDVLPFNARSASMLPKQLKKLEVGDTVSYSLNPSRRVVQLRKDFALLRFARIRDRRKLLTDLAGKALKERWDYPGSPPLHILKNYLLYTFARLEYEDRERAPHQTKIRIARQESRPTVAVFDTGLVNHLYQPIYAVFEQIPRRVPGEPGFTLVGFCSRGERVDGVRYLAFVEELPDRAEYFQNPADLLFDPKIRLDANYSHIIGDRSSRLPKSVLARIPKGSTFEGEEQWLAETIDKAIERAQARIRWNYKAAIPQYYEPTKHIQLLLPLCLDKPDKVDVALAVQRKDAVYTAETILELDWAYSNARLITRPDSDWLAVRALAGASGHDADGDE